MKTKSFMLMMFVMALGVILSGCGPADAQEATVDAPEEVVEKFYSWYIAYPGNPLVDGAHQSSEYLTEALVQKVDAVRASFDKGAYDPILCSQDIPDSFSVGDVSVSGDTATVVVETSFPGHVLTIGLKQADGIWRIDDTGCLVPVVDEPATPAPVEPATPTPAELDAQTPEDVVRVFYEWYIGTINASRAAGEMRNLLMDGSYRTTGYLTDELIAKIEATVASFEGGGYDPILCAQDVPQSFVIPSASVAPDRTTVVVETSFPGHAFQVDVVMVDGEWKIADIICAASDEGIAPVATAEPMPTPAVADSAGTEGWQVFRDDNYGFQLSYPQDWTFVEIELRNPELDKPLVRLVHLLPQAWADQLKTGGPPDPNSPPVIAPLAVEVSIGTMDEYRRAYVEPTHSETVQLGDYTATLEEYASGEIREIRYILQDPENSDLRVTVRDQLSGFPARVEGNEDVISVANLILTTFEFTE